MSLKFVSLCVALACVGCVDNAILELTIELPADPTPTDTMDPAVYAFIQTRSSRVSDFENDWLATESLDGFLLGSEPYTQTISIVAQPQDYEADLLLRVLYCSSQRCDQLSDDMAGERRLRIEHPFYDGERTRALWVVQEVTADVVETPELVPKCAVEGCREGDVREYCNAGTDVHFCSQ